MSRVLGFALLMLALSAAGAVARPIAIEDTLLFRKAGLGQISPDGRRIIYSRERVDVEHDADDGTLWIMNRDGSDDHEFIDAHNIRWSPAGDRIAYTQRTSHGYQLFVRRMAGPEDGVTRQITHGDLSPGTLRWSPDGRSIAFVASTPLPQADFRIELPKKPDGAKWNADATVVDRLHYRNIVGGIIRSAPQLFVLDAEGAGEPRQITHEPNGLGAREGGIVFSLAIEWTADGRAIVFDGGERSDDLASSLRSGINEVEVATGRVRRITQRTGFWDAPRVSPDGRFIAYEGYSDLKASFGRVDLHVMRRDGSDDRVLVRDAPDRIWQMFWSPDSRGVYWSANHAGTTNLHFVDLEGRDREITHGNWSLRLTSASPAGYAVVTREDQTTTGDVAVVELATGQVKTLTDMNRELKAKLDLPSATSFVARSRDGAPIQAFVTRPPDYRPGRTYPVILDIHGGPHEMKGFELDLRHQLFAAKGYVVVTANPRGSTGYGSAFANAISGAFPGRKDYEDLMAVVDTMERQGIVDRSREYVMGCSGGGALAAWAVGHTDRFAAAGVMCPITDWVSFAGSADVTGWAETRFDKPYWRDPSTWWAHSPMKFVDRVRTPTLLIVGDHDFRTPVSQAEEFYKALKIRGVDTRLILVNGATHQPWLNSPSDFMRVQLYLEKWFDQHRKPVTDGRP